MAKKRNRRNNNLPPLSPMSDTKNDKQLLLAFKGKALAESEWDAKESNLIDPVVGLLDQFDANKLKAVLDVLIPSAPEARSA